MLDAKAESLSCCRRDCTASHCVYSGGGAQLPFGRKLRQMRRPDAARRIEGNLRAAWDAILQLLQCGRECCASVMLAASKAIRFVELFYRCNTRVGRR